MAEMDGAAAAELVAKAIERVAASRAVPLVGINGAQGSGKSTLARMVADELGRRAIRPVLLSLDDFYFTKAEREERAARIHPLCATRGVPGTHDVPLLRKTLLALVGAQPDDKIALPVFDKLADDRMRRAQWRRFNGRSDAIILEGWCVGLQSRDLPPWQGPINALERECDAQGAWQAWSRSCLESEYDPLWRALDLLVSIAVPDLEAVIAARLQQEEELAAHTGRQGMDRAAVTRFVEHYERHTRALWAAMPQRAHLLLARDADYRFALIKGSD